MVCFLMIGSLQGLNTPLFKSVTKEPGDKYIDNYRPILVNSITGKVFERIIYNINQSLFANL